MAPRRFPPPWRAVETPGGYAIEDALGHRLAYVYGEDHEYGIGVRKPQDEKLTRDEARRIAIAIARLPKLLGADKESG